MLELGPATVPRASVPAPVIWPVVPLPLIWAVPALERPPWVKLLAVKEIPLATLVVPVPLMSPAVVLALTAREALLTTLDAAGSAVVEARVNVPPETVVPPA